MAEYIDRNLIEWYGCDLDGSCEHKECSECSQAECSHTQVMQIPTVNAILIPEGATNGDMIEVILPNAEIDPDPYKPSVDVYMGGILMMRIDRNLWNAKYNKEAEE